MDNEIKAKVKIDPDAGGAKQAQDDVKKLGDETEKAGEKAKQASFNFKKFADNAGIGATAVLGAVTGVAALAVKTAGEFETQEMAFKTLLGTSKAAKQELADIQKQAIQTPFNLPELLKGNQLLIAGGVSAKNAQEDMMNLGKAVAATGGGSDVLLRMASNLQQIKTVGKATAMDVRQFGMAGIPIYNLIADATGKTVAQVKDMDVTYEDLAAALSKAGQAGGRYADAFSNASDTFQVKWSNLQDAVNIGLANFAKNSGLFDIVKNGISGLTDFITSTAIPVITNFTNWITGNKDALAVLGGIIVGLIVAALIPLLIFLAPIVLSTLAFAAAGAALGLILSWLWPIIQTVTNFLKDHHTWLVVIGTFIVVMLIPTIWGLITAVATMAITFIASAIPAIIATIIAMWPLILIAGVVAVVVGLLYKAWQSNWGNIRGVTESIVNFIIGKLNSLIDKMNAVIGIYNKVVGAIGKSDWQIGEIGHIGAVSFDKTVNVSQKSSGGSALPDFSSFGDSGGNFTGAKIMSGGQSASVIPAGSSTIINQTNNNYSQMDFNSALKDMSWALNTK